MLAAVSGILGVVNLVVVIGNIFVLYVATSQKALHSPTNFLVLSLTISDLLLGVLILPFSIMQENRKEWIFGETWCTLWLALDVWLSTASIYNLLAISFDRYMAVRQPIKYPIISSTKVIRLMITAVWALSFCLALVLLILQMRAEPLSSPSECIPLTLPDAYILFSASFSFIIPAFIMVALNVSIFATVLKNTGRSRCVSVKGCSEMRIHRGNSSAKFQSLHHLTRTKSADGDSKKLARAGTSRGVSRATTANTTPSGSDTNLNIQTETTPLKADCNKNSSRSPSLGSVNAPAPQAAMRTFLSHVMVVSMLPKGRKKTDFLRQSSKLANIPNNDDLISTSKQRARFSLRTELRVARTTAVVVGVFVICWFPFTTIYVLQAYETCSMATGCIPGWLFTVAFWLGYSNSAVNPLLYAAFSRDFRAAFRKVLLRKQGSLKSF